MDPRNRAELNVLRARYLTKGGTGVAASVTAAATTKAITLPLTEPDANYGVLATPDWSTTVFVTGKSTTGFTINFGTAAPGGGGKVDYIVFRTER